MKTAKQESSPQITGSQGMVIVALLIAIYFVMGLTACATNPHRAVNLDTKVEHESIISKEQKIGVKNGDMVYQKKVMLSEELRSTMIKAHESEAALYGGPRYYNNNGLIGTLRSCRAQMSSMSDGKLQWTEKRDYVIPENETLNKTGLDENGVLIGITEEYIGERLDRFRQYKSTLDSRIEEMQEKISACRSQAEFETTHRSVAGEK